MEKEKLTYRSVDEYISTFPPQIQEKLEAIRKVIKDSAPGAEEKISYQMPTFALNGNIVFFAAFKNHIGLYPLPSAIDTFKERLSEYKCAKGSVQFPLDKQLPFDLISDIVKFRVAENTDKMKQQQNKCK